MESREHPTLDLDSAPMGSKISPVRYLTREQLDEYHPMRRVARRSGVTLPSSVVGTVYAFDLSRALELWQSASPEERAEELEKVQRDRQRNADAAAAADKRRLLQGVVETDAYLPASELCSKFDIKPGTLRQWASRNHVRTSTKRIVMGRGGYRKPSGDWERAHGYRDVTVYHVGDTIERARKSGMDLGERHAPDAQNALRMLHHAYRECQRLNVSEDALKRALLNLARGDDSMFPALETDQDAGLT